MALNVETHIPLYRRDTSVSYAQVCSEQEEHVATGKEAIFLCEHPPTITLGTGSSSEDLYFSSIQYERMGIEVVRSPRGGKATYHGPGQLVVYPILNLRERNLTIHTYLRQLEEIVINLCLEYGITAQRIEGKTGIWVEDRKIGFIGIRIRRGFSFHGLSIMVQPQQDAFRGIVPCGMANLQLTSIVEETQKEVDVWTVAEKIASHFAHI